MNGYYQEVATEDVAENVLIAAVYGMTMAAHVLGIEPVKIRWIRPCSESVWREKGKIMLFQQPPTTMGLVNIIRGVFLRANLSPFQAMLIASHELYHIAQFRAGRIPRGTMLSDDTREEIEQEADIFTARLFAPQPRPFYQSEYVIRYMMRNRIALR